MDTKAFAYFEAVCRLGSYAAAARKLGVTKQALSAHLSRLSIEQGVPLLEMGGTGLAPTNYGKIFLACCHDITGRLERFSREMATERAHCSNILRVGFVAGSLTYFGEGLFDGWTDANGKGAVHAVGDYQERALSCLLLEGEVDFAVMRRPPQPGVIAVPVVRDTMFFWANRANRLSRKELLTPADLIGQRLAALRFGEDDQEALMRFTQMASSSQMVFFDEMIDVFEEALAGRALGFTTRQHVERIPISTLTAVPYTGLRLEYFLCYNADRAISDSEAAFIDFMRDKARFYW